LQVYTKYANVNKITKLWNNVLGVTGFIS